MNDLPNVVPLFLSTESERTCVRNASEVPAFRPFVEKLNEEPRAIRSRCARLLAELFRTRLYPLDITEAQARTILAHTESRKQFIAAEFLRMQADEKWKSIYGMWRPLWCDITDTDVRTFVQYAVAMLARLYYLEPVAYMRTKRNASTVG
ncbi:hypothetical protein ACFLZO_00275 [Patescibacteria group bacterium]